MAREQTLQGSHDLIQNALSHLDQGITVFDHDLKLIAWNPRFLELYDFPERLAFVGAEFSSFIRYNAERGEYGEGELERQVEKRVEAARRFEPHRFVRERPDGSVMEVIGSPLAEGGFVATYTDITDTRRREATLEAVVAERTAALSLSEERLRIVANEVPAGIAHIGSDMKILFVNRRFARAYGLSAEDLIGRNAYDVLSQETMRFSAEFFEQTRRGQPVDFEMPLTLPDGRVKSIRTFLRPEREAHGDIIGFYLLSIDITRQKVANSAMLQAQKMEALGRLSSGIAHDFNNLLTVMVGNLTPLAERLDDRSLVDTFVQPALDAARRGSETTRRLLAVARKQPLRPETVDVDDAVRDLVRFLRPSLPENIEVTSTTRARSTLAHVDGAQLEMALLNLAMNARDAMAQGGRIGFVTDLHRLDGKDAEAFRLRAGTYVRIVVEDEGPGVPSDIAARIFEPFFTTKFGKGGSGLGLAMVDGFVRQSNGAIRLETSGNGGARFVIYLPQAERQADRALRTLQAPPSEMSPRLTLLVDDDDDVRAVVRRQLTELGFPTIEAQDGDEALRLLEQIEDVELLLTDYDMPGALTGLDLAREARSVSAEISVVIMTGQSIPETDLPVLRKPFGKAELAEALNGGGAKARTSRPVEHA